MKSRIFSSRNFSTKNDHSGFFPGLLSSIDAALRAALFMSLARSRAIALLLLPLSFNSLLGAEGPPTPNPKEFSEVTKGTQKFDGLFTLYRTNETLYGEIKPGQFNQPLLAPIAIARGLALAGQPLNFGDEWVLSFSAGLETRSNSFAGISIIRRPTGTPLDKAVKQNYIDSVSYGHADRYDQSANARDPDRFRQYLHDRFRRVQVQDPWIRTGPPVQDQNFSQ